MGEVAAPHRVAIIGAGVSGLRCATVLLKNSFDVTIFEARNRVGGRVGLSDTRFIRKASQVWYNNSAKQRDGRNRSRYVSRRSSPVPMLVLILLVAPTGFTGTHIAPH